eukprot:2675010-Rhodomonas_salina.1
MMTTMTIGAPGPPHDDDDDDREGTGGQQGEDGSAPCGSVWRALCPPSPPQGRSARARAVTLDADSVLRVRALLMHATFLSCASLSFTLPHTVLALAIVTSEHVPSRLLPSFSSPSSFPPPPPPPLPLPVHPFVSTAQAGADPDMCDAKGHTPLDAAAYFGHADGLLIISQSRLSLLNRPDRFSVLFRASQCGIAEHVAMRIRACIAMRRMCL